MDHHFGKSQAKRKNRKFRIRIYLASGGIFLILTGIFYIVQLSPIFRIRDFNISGKEHLTDEEVIGILEPLVIKSRVRTFLGKDNMLSWGAGSPDTSKTALIEALIDRDWIRQSLDISIKERERLAIWCDSKGDCSWIDSNGMLFEKAPQVEGSLIMTITDIYSSYISQGTGIYEERFIENIIKLLNGLKGFRLAIAKIDFDPKLQEIRVKNYSGPELLFSVRFDPATNLDSLKSLIEKGEFEKYRYIDLRVENRIYYKTI